MRIMTIAAIGMFLLSGCASSARQALEEAEQSYSHIHQNPSVAENAPQDRARAADSLERAQRLASYWGSSVDAAHFAYLSKRYSEIAESHGQLAVNQQRIERRERQLDSLQQAYEAARLVSIDLTE